MHHSPARQSAQFSAANILHPVLDAHVVDFILTLESKGVKQH